MVRTHEKISGLELEAAVLENALFRHSARDPRFDYYFDVLVGKNPSEANTRPNTWFYVKLSWVKYLSKRPLIDSVSYQK